MLPVVLNHELVVLYPISPFVISRAVVPASPDAYIVPLCHVFDDDPLTKNPYVFLAPFVTIAPPKSVPQCCWIALPPDTLPKDAVTDAIPNKNLFAAIVPALPAIEKSWVV